MDTHDQQSGPTNLPYDPKRRWSNMRKMAWVAMLASLAFPLLIYATNASVLGAIAGPFYLFTGAVVGAYMGFSTWGDKGAG